MVRAALTLPLIPARARGACRRSPSIRYKPVCDNRLDCCWHHELIKKQKMVGTETEVIEYCEDCRSATSPPPPSPPPPPAPSPPADPIQNTPYFQGEEVGSDSGGSTVAGVLKTMAGVPHDPDMRREDLPESEWGGHVDHPARDHLAPSDAVPLDDVQQRHKFLRTSVCSPPLPKQGPDLCHSWVHEPLHLLE